MDAKVPENIASLLLIDQDSEYTQKFISHVLPEIAVSICHTATNLKEASQYFLEFDYSIVLIDEKLPDLEFQFFATQMKCRDHEPEIICLSDSFDQYRFSDLINAGAKRVFLKEDAFLILLPSEIKKILRHQKANQSRLRILSKLTEANSILEEKNRRLDEFSATLAHDIRGPLGAISMRIEYLLEAYREEFDKKCEDILVKTLHTTDRLTKIVQAMYDYARLGEKATKMFEVDLTTIIREVISDLSFDESLEIQIEITDLPFVWGNPELLRRVFINLLNNAVKYNDKKDIVIQIKYEGTVERTLANFCRISLKDNGPGIDKHELKELFSFFKRGETGKKKSDGLGVGLSVVHRILELHYGRVSVESEIGEGTTFFLELPLETIFFE
jgi:signal transduction histidine kinase